METLGCAPPSWKPILLSLWLYYSCGPDRRAARPSWRPKDGKRKILGRFQVSVRFLFRVYLGWRYIIIAVVAVLHTRRKHNSQIILYDSVANRVFHAINRTVCIAYFGRPRPPDRKRRADSQDLRYSSTSAQCRECWRNNGRQQKTSVTEMSQTDG